MLTYPFRYLAWLISNLLRAIRKSPDYVLFLLEEELPALPDPPIPRWQRLFSKPRMSLKVLGERFDLIAREPRTIGVVLHLRPVPMSMATPARHPRPRYGTAGQGQKSRRLGPLLHQRDLLSGMRLR
ncbi:MAG TPA: hypothetical protein VGJ79_10455 [Candidatus Dormibacteraeota bacterium]